jgi:hypothetical protein
MVLHKRVELLQWTAKEGRLGFGCRSLQVFCNSPEALDTAAEQDLDLGC